MKYLLDTHVWIWWHSRPGALPPKITKIIESGKYSELLLSTISIWELTKLVEKGRLRLSIEASKWVAEALDLPKLRVVPLSPEIAVASTQLPEPFHDDSADQIIVATAREENAVILTKDELISKYPHVRA